MARRQIKINENISIGGKKTFIIAEVGSNHNQSLTLAKEHIDAATEAGADAVKFQSINIDELYYRPPKKIKELHKKIDFDEKWHYELKEYSDKKKIVFFSSPTYLKAVDILEKSGVQLYKLASAQIGTFPQIIEKVAKTKKPVLISTGLVTINELINVVKLIRRYNSKLIILHCNSIYPTPYNKVNLNLINLYAKKFNCIAGFSDHTPDIYMPIAAVALGAKVIEKHFIIDHNISTPDSALSLDHTQFTNMVDGIRATEQAIETSMRNKIQKEEKEFKEDILYRLVLNKDKRSGEIFAKSDFDFNRNNKGIDCRKLDLVLEKIPIKRIRGGTLIKMEMLKGK